MKIIATTLFALSLALPAAAQDGIATTRGSGAVLRALDKVSSEITDLQLSPGDSAEIGRLTVRLGECRYPSADPNSDAFAQLVITDRNSRATLFDGWMIASSPALSALDDARYDVWVLACNTA
ncbi:DUF2155 domain-containing protein [Paracoccus aerodenitrificans]|uniref:DUF2155 domain-containing protein n=1 Tax=Paracoccus aerodenitrificans TaxID=3017781 RepID=UPI0022F0C0CD|nr:DUF2155 domain-containing protein [Paracoccus aerodenitrificans]WBU64245.1 DUF2155 domain-containing protein [Paracoccus aerodenitrificans]